MGLFGKKEPRPDLVDRIAEVERHLKALDLEWTEMFEKFSRLYARLAKRAKAEQERAEAPPEARSSTPPLRITNPLALALLRGSDGVLPPTR